MSPPILSVKDLAIEADAGRWLLDGLSFEIEVGEAVGLVGRSGTGKSTLVSLLAGTLAPGLRVARGEVLVLGLPVPRPLTVGVLWQDAASTFDPLRTIGAHVEELRKVAEHAGRKVPDRASLLAQVGLDAKASEMYPHQLSGGMLQRAQLAVVLATEPELIIADEPTTALDTESELEVLAHLRSAREGSNRALLFISHGLSLVAQMTSRVLILSEGRVAEEGPSAQLLQAPKSPEARALAEAGVLRRD